MILIIGLIKVHKTMKITLLFFKVKKLTRTSTAHTTLWGQPRIVLASNILDKINFKGLW
jgi:hypothetical protein